MSGPVQQTTRTLIDGSLVASVASSIVWLQYLQTATVVATAGATLVLLGLRIVIAYGEVKDRKRQKLAAKQDEKPDIG